jgi:hypothetical protein
VGLEHIRFVSVLFYFSALELFSYWPAGPESRRLADAVGIWALSTIVAMPGLLFMVPLWWLVYSALLKGRLTSCSRFIPTLKVYHGKRQGLSAAEQQAPALPEDMLVFDMPSLVCGIGRPKA